jgi:hypothetical protein
MRLPVLLLLSCLAARPTAQCLPARYSSFGQGCIGSGQTATPCVSYNTNQGNLSGTATPADFAVLANSGQAGMAVCGVSFSTRSASGQPVTTTVSIYDRPTGAEPGLALGSTTMAIGGTLAVHSAVFSPSVIIPPQTGFFLVIDARPRITLPLAITGTQITHYWGAPGSWSAPLSHNWKFQLNCCTSGAVPLLLNQGTPRVGGVVTTLLSQAAPNALALQFTGFSDTTWNGIPLPLDLTLFGAPGCRLLAPGTLIQTIAVDAGGNGSLPLQIPAIQVLCGARIIQQWLVVDPSANTVGLAFSNGGAGTIGS